MRVLHGTSAISRLCFGILLLASLSRGCILLLDGWVPLSVEERAKLADIVAVGRVNKSFKHVTNSSTYEAQVDILRVLKGRLNSDRYEILSNSELVSDLATGSRRVRHKRRFRKKRKLKRLTKRFRVAGSHAKGYLNDNDLTKQRGVSRARFHGYIARYGRHDVSNFGDKSLCYADVEENKIYILFLTVFNNKLTAKYDDLFGAVEDFSEEKERRILFALGWDVWSPWSTCSEDCDGGTQTRTRKCLADDDLKCEGRFLDKRRCNLFSCKDAVNVLKSTLLPSLPSGVAVNPKRTTSFLLSSSARISAPIGELYRLGMPKEYSIHISYQQTYKDYQVIFCLDDQKNDNKLIIRIGQDVLLYFKSGYDIKDTILFTLNVSDVQWHSLSLGIRNSLIVLYFDCYLKYSGSFPTTASPRFTSETSVHIGGCDTRDNEAFQGSVDQITMTSHADDAGNQCYFGDRKDDFVALVTPQVEFPVTVAPTSSVADIPSALLQWSEWTACSHSCGWGYSLRRVQCTPDDDICRIVLKSNIIQTRTCRLRICSKKKRCKGRCRNGGICTRSGKCRCLSGYYGEFCDEASCRPGCHGNGFCLTPDKCTCLAGYTGTFCETAVCDPPCQHGGYCVKPGYCSCPYGYLPPLCTPLCPDGCHNGGICVKYNYCQCQPGYSGHMCQQALCTKQCQNGGICTEGDRCLCPLGYSGDSCENRTCDKTTHYVPYIVTYRQLYTASATYQCGFWGLNTCNTPRYLYRVGYKTLYKVIYRCKNT